MRESYLDDRPIRGRTFAVAIGVLGSIALVQMIALSSGLFRQAAGTGGSRAEAAASAEALPPGSLPAPVAPAVALSTGDPAPLAPVAAVTPDLATRGAVESVPPPEPAVSAEAAAPVAAVGSQNAPPPEGPAPPATRAVAPSDPGNLQKSLSDAAASHALSDEPILEALLKTGADLRSSGNTQGALQAFREVETARPEHPRVLSEMAATLGMMGLEERAREYWERVEKLGEIRAGAYFPVAVSQLRGEAAVSAPVPPPVIMKIGEVKVEEQPPDGGGQKVSLRVVIDSDPALQPKGEDISVLVYFYDRDASGAILHSTADTSYLYPSEPYDWKVNGTEEIVVNYHQPVLSEEQKRDLGDRRYHGYAIELYYRDILQDKVAKPDEVARLRLEAVSPVDSPPATDGIAPQNDLFPNPANP